jgi:hypothetical protein
VTQTSPKSCCENSLGRPLGGVINGGDRAFCGDAPGRLLGDARQRGDLSIILSLVGS